MTAGLIVCMAAVAVAAGGGLTWRQRSGRMRPVAPRRGAPAGAAPGGTAGSGAGSAGRAAPEYGVATNSSQAAPAAGSALQAPGSLGPALSGPAPSGPALSGPVISGPAFSGPVIGAPELGQPLGSRATLVQFSSAFCAPCRATRQLLAELAGMTDGVAHVDIDAESHLELVRRLGVRRTPTVFVLGPDGRIARRASGQPCKADLIAALGEVI